MDQQHLIKAINHQEQRVERRLKPLETTDIEKAFKTLNGKLISQATEDELKDKLKIIYMMIGLRPHHFPVEEEKQFLHNYIYSKYGNKTLSELVLAFDLAIQGQLDVEDTKVYDQFTCEYLAKIMNGYRKWLLNVHNNAVAIKKDTMLIGNEQPLTYDDKIDWLNSYKNSDINVWMLPTLLYEFIVEQKFIEISDEEKSIYFGKAKEQIRYFLSDYTENERDKKNDFLLFKQMEKTKFEGYILQKIKDHAKKIVLNDYLKSLA